MSIWFTEKDRLVYVGWGGIKYDPLALRNALVLESAGAIWKINELRRLAAEVLQNPKDSTIQGQAELNHALYLTDLVRIARVAFRLPDFPEATDAQAIAALDDFMAWLDRKKAETYTEARVLAAYRALGNPVTMTYEMFVGLEMNRPEIELKQAWVSFLGVAWAMSNQKLPRSFFDAAADSPGEADDLEYETNRGRE